MLLADKELFQRTQCPRETEMRKGARKEKEKEKRKKEKKDETAR